MKFRVAAVLALFAMFSIGTQAAPRKQVIRGYLVDNLCVRERHDEGAGLGPKHSRNCLRMPECVASGFAVMTPENKVYRFDAKGNASAKKLVEATPAKEKDWKVVVTGVVKGSEITVTGLTLAK